MNVPFVDLKTQYIGIKDEVLKEINEVLDKTAYICGKKVKQFEETFAKLQDVKHFIGLSSGTDALHVALVALGIGNGDEVIVPVNTFIATSEAIALCGGKVVFVDHDERTYNIDTSLIEKAITPKTKAIIAVHLYGQPAEMDRIMEIAKKHNLYVIEDCSQAHLATYKGKKVGGIGHIGTFSFYPGKNLGAYGEGGGVSTNDDELHNKMLLFRQHGSNQKYIHEIEGHNYRLEEIQGAVLNVKSKYIVKWTENRRRLARMYSEKLTGMENAGFITPFNADYINPVYHLYVVRAQKRDDFMKYLGDKGVQSALHYPLPLHLQMAYEHLGYKKGDFPVAEKCCAEIVSLPMYPEMTDEMVNYVCETIKNYFD